MDTTPATASNPELASLVITANSLAESVIARTRGTNIPAGVLRSVEKERARLVEVVARAKEIASAGEKSALSEWFDAIALIATPEPDEN